MPVRILCIADRNRHTLSKWFLAILIDIRGWTKETFLKLDLQNLCIYWFIASSSINGNNMVNFYAFGGFVGHFGPEMAKTAYIPKCYDDLHINKPFSEFLEIQHGRQGTKHGFAVLFSGKIAHKFNHALFLYV